MKVGSKLGNLIKVNNATNNVSWGHYACICVEVDLLKPLVSKFRLKRIRKLEYEGIHLVSHSDSRPDPFSGSEPSSGCENIYWDSLLA